MDANWTSSVETRRSGGSLLNLQAAASVQFKGKSFIRIAFVEEFLRNSPISFQSALFVDDSSILENREKKLPKNDGNVGNVQTLSNK